MAQASSFKCVTPFATLSALALLAAAPAASAQSMSANSASYNAGYNRSAGSENHAIALATARDANGNRTVIDGIIQTGASTVSAKAAAFAVADSSGGVGAGGASLGSATAVGNSLNVVTTGSYNTVIVNSQQTNTGNISANVNGGVGN